MFRSLLARAYRITVQFGIDPLKIALSIRGIFAYWRDYNQFRTGYSGPIKFYPCLTDRYQEGGITNDEYFWQDLTVARWIFDANPVRHVDVGSRTDGFVAHVASFRDIEVFDVRPITTEVPGVIFRQANLTDNDSMALWRRDGGYCDSLSCLHVVEHFGLGRYGDYVDAQGVEKGFKNLSSLLTQGGRLYLSTPIGQQRVEFNANWVFYPETILRYADNCGLRLERLSAFGSQKGLYTLNMSDLEAELNVIREESYSLGIFTFIKDFVPSQ
jgi:hypothetical protein